MAMADTDEPTQLGAITLFRKILGIPIPLIPLSFFFDAAALHLNTGTSIAEALSGSSDVGDPELRHIFTSIAPKLRNGASLCACLRPYEDRFPEIVMPLLEVGEAAGGLPGQAKRLAETFRVSVEAGRKYRYSVYDPKLIFILFCLVLFVGQIVVSFLSPVSGVPPAVEARERGIHFVMIVLSVMLVLYTIRRILMLLYQFVPAARLFVDTVKLAIPAWGQVFRNLSAARWARSFATLWAAGINISTALEISSRSAINANYERGLLRCVPKTRAGIPLSRCLVETQLLPANLIRVIETCEQTGRLDENLVVFAENMERQALGAGIEAMNKTVVLIQLIFFLAAIALVLTLLAA